MFIQLHLTSVPDAVPELCVESKNALSSHLLFLHVAVLPHGFSQLKQMFPNRQKCTVLYPGIQIRCCGDTQTKIHTYTYTRVYLCYAPTGLQLHSA